MFSTEGENLVYFIAICGLLLLLLTSIIILFVYQYQQRKDAYFQAIEQLKTNHENDLLKSKIEIQEQTFANISREIHDNIGQKLTLAKLQMNTLKIPVGGQLKHRIDDLIGIVGDVILDLRDISRSLSSEIILSNGLINALEFEIYQLNKSGLYKIKLIIVGEPVFFSSDAELVLFRITQEVLSNIMKHADANTIVIELSYQLSHLSLKINDDGKGFVDQANSRGNGLNNITKRAKMLSGVCDIHSEINVGTTVTIQIPIYEQKVSA